MASLGASAVLCSSIPSSSSSSSSSRTRREMTRATINLPRLRNVTLSLPKLPNIGGLMAEDLEFRSRDFKNTTTKVVSSDPMVVEKLYAILEAISDRVEIHKNIEQQRNNWNSLLLTSINGITLTAATMAGIAAMTSSDGASLIALKLSSSLLYLAATGMLMIMNKIQPSQLAEEQRNSARLFKQLQREIETALSIGEPTMYDVDVAMDKVLALDRAYPLPLLGAMLEKFPAAVEPAVWWPERRRREKGASEGTETNGWDAKLEEEMREIAGVMKRKDEEDYLRLGDKALRLNKALAVSGPLLTGLAALGSAFVGHGPWAAVVGVAGGAMASVVNALEHGGQVGMVVEMYRSNAGFFKLLQETVESNLEEREVGMRRENGELFEMKMALKLGRSLSELKELAASSSIKGKAIQEFASKLF